MPDYLKAACEEISATLFSSDPSEEALQQLEAYMDRWKRGIAERREILQSSEEDI